MACYKNKITKLATAGPEVKINKHKCKQIKILFNLSMSICVKTDVDAPAVDTIQQ